MSHLEKRTTVNGVQEWLEGRKIRTLRVLALEQKQPLKWKCICERCSVSSVYTHEHLTRGSARCANKQCSLIQGAPTQTPPKEIDWSQCSVEAFDYFKEQQAIADEKAQRGTPAHPEEYWRKL
jgi:hypothetical protein